MSAMTLTLDELAQVQGIVWHLDHPDERCAWDGCPLCAVEDECERHTGRTCG